MQVGLIGAGNVARALARSWGDGRTTARGLAALERGGVRPAFQDVFDAVIDWA